MRCRNLPSKQLLHLRKQITSTRITQQTVRIAPGKEQPSAFSQEGLAQTSCGLC